MRYWWVNQNQTFDFEVPGGFLWSPKTRSDGAKHYFYDTMAELRPGDVVFSFCDTVIRAIGIVQRPAVTAPKPDFQGAGGNWSEIGWLVDVEFSAIERPVSPKDFMEQIRPLLAARYAPLQNNGNGNQGVYLTEISFELGQLLVMLSNANLYSLQHALAPLATPDEDSAIEYEIRAKLLDGDLEGIQLVKSRRGQGIFKSNVRLIEKACRVTGVTNVKHLRASHIKPWSVSSNDEKLDGNNGLLLSPHVDHLFDRGFITFTDAGEIRASRELNPEILTQWSIDSRASVGDFRPAQRDFLEYHRDVVFQS